MKEKKIIKIALFCIITFLIFMLIGIFILLNFLFDDKDYCLDSSVCREGLKINTEYGLIKINENNCVKHKWTWDKESKMCIMSSLK